MRLFFVIAVSLGFCAQGFGQQNVFSRSDVSTGNWGDGQLPWFYETGNFNYGNPDDDDNISNFVRIGHNNNLNMTLNGRAYQARELIFEAGASFSRTIGGENLEMRPNNGDCKIENQSIANHTFNNSIELFSTTQFNPVNGNLTINGNILTNNNFIDVFGNGGHTLTINGVINGTNGLGVQGNSIVVLNATNTYSGSTFINNGRVVLANAGGLGGTMNGTTIENGAVLELNAGANYPAEALNLNGTGQSSSGALIKSDTDTRQYPGNITLNSDSRITVNGGTLDYRGAFNFNGNTAYFGGVLNFEFGFGSDILNANKTADNGAIFKDGSGYLELRPSSELTGTINLVQGSIKQGPGTYPSTGTLRLSEGTIYQSNSDTDRDMDKSTEVLGNITIGSSTDIGGINFTNNFNLTSGIRELNMPNDNEISGVISNGSIIKSGSGSLTFSGSLANSLGLNSEVDEGILILNKDAGIQATDNLIINSLGSVRTDADNQWGTGTPPFIQIFGNGFLDINSTNQNLALGSTSPSSSVLLGAGTLTINNTATDEFQGVISGTGGIIKTNSGTQILSGVNTYSGTTEIAGGTLRISGDERVSDNSDLILNGGTFSTGGAIGFNETMSELLLSSSSTIALAPGAHTTSFSASNTQVWASDATLTITGWQGTAEAPGTEGRIFVGSDELGLTSVQLAKINFDGFSAGAVILNTGEVVPRDGNFRLLDDFNRADNIVLGSPDSYPGSWVETENLSTGTAGGNYIEVLNQNLRLHNCESGDNDGGNKSAAFDVTGLYANIFEEAGGELRWYFNMKQSRSNPAGFGGGDYGTAFIIGANESDFSSATIDGYAVVLGETESNDAIRLIHFTDGIPSNPVPNTILAIQPNSANLDHYFSIVVTFDPCEKSWGLNIRDDGDAGFINPISVDDPTLLNTDETHISQPLNYLGGYFTHNSGCTEDALFDNVYIPTELPETATYTWSGGTSGDFQLSTNWSPQRACVKNNDELIFNTGGNIEAFNVPDQIIGSLQVTGNTQVTFRDETVDTGTSSIQIRNSGQGFFVEAGSSLSLDVPPSGSNNGIEIDLTGSTTGVIDGALIMINTQDGAARDHRLEASASGGIQVNGLVTLQDLNGPPFGSSTANSVVFNAGSTLEVYDGANPFQLSAPASVVTFNSGSTYSYLDNQAGLSISGRTYANFVFNIASGETETISFSGNEIWNVENLSVISGTLDAQPTGQLNINISGNLFANSGATLNLNPNLESTLNFNGNTLQTISGGGNINFGENQILQFDNSFTGGTKAISLDRNITLLNDLIVLNGRVEGTGFELTMAGVDHIIQVDDDIFGEFAGNNNEIELVIEENTTLTGSASTCDFYNITVASGKTLTLQRSIQCLNGNFNISDGSTLLINAGGFVESDGLNFRSPNYGLGSTLIYDTGLGSMFPYLRNVEWISESGSGYPYNVLIRTGTTLNPGAFGYNSEPLSLQNDLEIEFGANLFMDLNSDDMTEPLKIGGDLNLAGVLALSDVNGGDLEISGDWNHTGIFNGKQRRISFLGSTAQTVSSGNDLSFAFCTINNTSAGGVTYDGDISITTELTFTDGIFFGQGMSQIVFESGSSHIGSSNASHIDGWVRKVGADDFVFPTGGFYNDPDGSPQNYLQEIRIFDLSGSLTFDARYFPETHPDLPGSGYYDGTSQQISGCDYWTLDRVETSGDANVAITYGNTPCNVIDPIDGYLYLGIAKYTAGAWVDPIFLPAPDPDPVNPEVSFQFPISNFSDFALTSSGGFGFNVLPIELLSFSAKNINNQEVLLEWSTATETNNDFFTLERSVDGQNFEIIGTVDGAGNSTTTLYYSFVDDDPYSGISYYRLKQTDFDGSFAYSDLEAVEIDSDDNFKLDAVYSSDGGVRLIYTSENPFLSLEIFDMTGQLVHRQRIENNGNTLVYPNIARGVYLLRLSNGSQMASEKFFY